MVLVVSDHSQQPDLRGPALLWSGVLLRARLQE